MRCPRMANGEGLHTRECERVGAGNNETRLDNLRVDQDALYCSRIFRHRQAGSVEDTICACLGGAALVTEVVFENRQVKAEVIHDDAVLNKDAVLASDTSTLSIT
jgi:3-hydroxyacyl-CoA dehydrogenase